MNKVTNHTVIRSPQDRLCDICTYNDAWTVQVSM